MERVPVHTWRCHPPGALSFEDFLVPSGDNEAQNIKRAAATYTCIRSPFLLPVWAVNPKSSEWYRQLQYPNLTPLLTILKRNLPDQRYLHRVFYPIAMALDTLHTVVPEKRSYVFHRDVCLDNVFMPECSQCVPNEVVYGNARLRLSHLSKQVFSEETSENSVGLLKYYHLADRYYTREHDWYSFGVFMIEVIFEIYEGSHGKISDKLEFRENGSYDKYCQIYDILRGWFSTHVELGLIRSEFIINYLDIAKMCMDAVANKKEIKLVSEWQSYVFEYEINEVAAQLFVLYKEWENYNNYKYHKCGKKFCQSCLTAKTENIPTRTFRCGNPDGCNSNCTYYCVECYRNGEKVFCPEHGTASPVLGHMSSYALIFFGEQYQPNSLKDSFKKDAEQIRNVLMHPQVHGMREANIVLKGLEGGDPKASFEEAIGEMAKKIHKFDAQNNCTNDHQYELLIYYSGHGNSMDEPGSWRPTEGTILSSHEVHDQLKKLRDCPGCQTRKCCVQIIWLMDHCYQDSEKDLQALQSLNKENPRTLAVHLFSDEEAYTDEYGRGYITIWFCDVLLSKVIVKKLPTDETDSSKKSGFVTAEDLPSIVKYKKGNEQKEQNIQIKANRKLQNYPLAYYNTTSVKYTVFSLFLAGEPCEWNDFTDHIDLEAVEQKVKDQLQIRDTVLLLTNRTSDHTKHTLVWDHELKNILKMGYSGDSRSFPAAVYYQKIERHDQLTVELLIKDTDYRTSLLLPISEKNLCLLSGVDTKRTNLLPNILVYIVHTLYRSQPMDESAQKNRPTTSDGLLAAPSDSNKPCEQLVWESLIRKIDNNFEMLPKKSEYGVWLHLGHKAAQTDITVVNTKDADKLKGIDTFVFHVNASSLEWGDDRFHAKPSSLQPMEGSFRKDLDMMTSSDEGFGDTAASIAEGDC